MQLTDNDIKLLVAGIAVLGAVLVAFLSALLARSFARRDRRREMYGEAYRAALEWREMLYRIRRRSTTSEAEQDLVNRFHDLQERILFHEGWIGGESRYMQRSYCRFVRNVREVVRPLIQKAWESPPESRVRNAVLEEDDPDISSETARYLRDVRAHLSMQPWRRLAMAVRNWKDME